jgi:hypothetical protein
MATNLASNIAEKIMGDVPTSTTQDKTRNPTGEKMKATVWHGKHDVRVELVDKPQVIEPTDALIAVQLLPLPVLRACMRSFMWAWRVIDWLVARQPSLC